MCRIYERSNIVHPLYTSSLCVAIVNDVVDMALITLLAPIPNTQYCTRRKFNPTMLSCSPHSMGLLNRPLLPSAVRKPSLPATSSRQLHANSSAILPVSWTCSSLQPNMMHFPILFLTSESHLEGNCAVIGSFAFCDSRQVVVLKLRWKVC